MPQVLAGAKCLDYCTLCCCFMSHICSQGKRESLTRYPRLEWGGIPQGVWASTVSYSNRDAEASMSPRLRASRTTSASSFSQASQDLRLFVGRLNYNTDEVRGRLASCTTSLLMLAYRMLYGREWFDMYSNRRFSGRSRPLFAMPSAIRYTFFTFATR